MSNEQTTNIQETRLAGFGIEIRISDLKGFYWEDDENASEDFYEKGDAINSALIEMESKLGALFNLKPGDEVFWNDPDEGISSGKYKILLISTISGFIESKDSVLLLVNEHGSETEVYASELS